jgi:maleate isomerase
MTDADTTAMTQARTATALPYRLTAPIGHDAILGVIVLQADETVDPDFARLFRTTGTAVYASRVPSGADLTPETLAAMAEALPAAAGLLPPSLDFDVIGYACTSGATVIGRERVARLVRGARPCRHVTDPLTAALAAFRALGIRAPALLSPYVPEVSASLRATLTAEGLTLPVFASFEEREEARVARIDPRSIAEAAIALGRDPAVDAVFLSCTNLRTLDILEEVEAETGKPAISSNQALAWHMACLAGIAPPALGRLAACRLPAIPQEDRATEPLLRNA